LIHCFSLEGVKLVYDAHSQALHQVDDLAWAVLKGEDFAALGQPPAAEELAEVKGEIASLQERGLLFCPDPYGGYEPPAPAVKALCLNVAHACNLACRYCFAGKGQYGEGPALMPLHTARRAVEFLLANAGSRQRLEIDFFGGEPLLNWDVVKETVFYARRRGAEAGKTITFTLTTNALLLDEGVTGFCLQHGVNVVLSLDGRREVHDRLRLTPGGQGSYDLVVRNVRRFVRSWTAHPEPKGYYFIRGTFTRHNPDFADDFLHLVDLGFDRISIEPVVAAPGEPHALTGDDLPRLEAEYERLARAYLGLRREGRMVRFFHFELDLDRGPCLAKRLTGCAAGTDYLAVAPGGGIYPCHQFVGRPDFLLGSVETGVANRPVVEMFRHAHVYAKARCRACWAKFLCSGGCHAAAFLQNGSILEPYDVGCRLMHKRLECALFIKARELERRCQREISGDS